MGFYGFAPYVSVAEKRKNAEKTIKKLKKKNPDISPVIIEGRNLSNTWWGKAWNKNLESYADYENRINRGRSYARHGAVVDIKISSGNISALVIGSGSKPYEVNIKVDGLSKNTWNDILKKCIGKVHSMEELLGGKFPKVLEELFTSKGKGLFPSPKEIKLNCDCPDWANMCKHVAAALYGVGARLDENPKLFFTLRDVNIDDIITEAINKETETLLEKSKSKGRRVIDDSDVFDMFGIDVEQD